MAEVSALLRKLKLRALILAGLLVGLTTFTAPACGKCTTGFTEVPCRVCKEAGKSCETEGVGGATLACCGDLQCAPVTIHSPDGVVQSHRCVEP